MPESKIKYALSLDECSEILGTYDSIEQAKLEAESLAREHGEPMKAVIYTTRPATPEDSELFGFSEEVNTEDADWWKECFVPENEVLAFTTALQAKA